MTKVIIVEFLFTFALTFVVLNVATAKGTDGNSFYGLAIGFTVLAGAYAVGSISGGVFNPAVGTGVALLGLLNWTNLGIYAVTQLVAGAVAGVIFRVSASGRITACDAAIFREAAQFSHQTRRCRRSSQTVAPHFPLYYRRCEGCWSEPPPSQLAPRHS